MNRISALAMILLLAASNLIIVNSSSAQSISDPSVPEFTLEFTIQSYDVPATTPVYTIDPYTGQQKIQTPNYPGYHVDTRIIEIKLKNHPFTSYTDDEYHRITLFYNVSYKGHFENEWSTFYNSQQSGGGFPQSISDYTTINFTQLPSDGGTIDIRVQAQTGYYSEYHMPFVAYHFIGQASGWSNIQTIDVPASTTVTPTAQASTTMESPTTTPNLTGIVFDSQLTWLLVGVVVGLGAIVGLLVVVIVFMRRRIEVLERKIPA